eukprot:CAMPEP_0114147856 /NCGR_PEP_ID=MMETSP0043_2-20121206/21327_1 /TAXON_ID=464988 /ORGANISM="Hemiselmis andersenii, Strain CCMP644" /LENGTH=285 /DNA_ID=CAMNT_0001242417 /DNA_START=64 /DNA_END=921 /DNA_ORIENTATION=-
MAAPQMENSMQQGLLMETAGGNTLDAIVAGEGMILRQKTSECCRCCCCQPPIHWIVTPYDPNWAHDKPYPTIASVSEVGSTWCGRCCSFNAPGFRKTKYEVRAGIYDEEAPNGAPVLWTHEKAETCGANVYLGQTDSGQLRVPCCCNLPYLVTKDANGAQLGKTQYLCDACLFVPKFSVHDKNDNEVYRLRPDTCFFGCCVRCRCTCNTKDGKCCRVPFLVRDPKTLEQKGGQVTDLWAGVASECCTHRGTYQIQYPPQCDNSMRATLQGSALLVDLVIFEQDQD